MLYFLLHVLSKLTSCLLEWVYTRVNDAFLLFECYEILVALTKPGKQVEWHVSCDRHCFVCFFSCSSGHRSFSLLIHSPLSLLSHGLSAILSLEYKQRTVARRRIFFLSIPTYSPLFFIIIIILALKWGSVPLLLPRAFCHARSHGVVLTCHHVLFSESGITHFYTNCVFCFFLLTFKYSVNWYKYIYQGSLRVTRAWVGLGHEHIFL